MNNTVNFIDLQDLDEELYNQLKKFKDDKLYLQEKFEFE